MASRRSFRKPNPIEKWPFRFHKSGARPCRNVTTHGWTEAFKILVFNSVTHVERMSTHVYSCRQEVDSETVLGSLRLTCTSIKSLSMLRKYLYISNISVNMLFICFKVYFFGLLNVYMVAFYICRKPRFPFFHARHQGSVRPFW